MRRRLGLREYTDCLAPQKRRHRYRASQSLTLQVGRTREWLEDEVCVFLSEIIINAPWTRIYKPDWKHTVIASDIHSTVLELEARQQKWIPINQFDGQGQSTEKDLKYLREDFIDWRRRWSIGPSFNIKGRLKVVHWHNFDWIIWFDRFSTLKGIPRSIIQCDKIWLLCLLSMLFRFCLLNSNFFTICWNSLSYCIESVNYLFDLVKSISS